MSIQRLPRNVAAQIASSAAVASLNDAVLGLLRNSLDAGAGRVAICVDYARGGCVVHDDGRGIPPDEFRADGGLGKRHYTSKYPPTPEVHGRRGAFLASTAALSLLTIVSRCVGHDGPHALIVHDGTVLGRGPPPESAVDGTNVDGTNVDGTTVDGTDADPLLAGAAHGTRVTVRDLFGCLPVRARRRPAAGSPRARRAWDDLVLDVTALLLAWPQDVVVSVALGENGGHARYMQHMQRMRRMRHVRRTLRTGRSAHGRDDAVRTAWLVRQAGLAVAVNPTAWVHVSAAAPGLSVAGCVCLVPQASRRAQFLRIGIEPLAAASDAHVDALRDDINRLFAQSAFGAVGSTDSVDNVDSVGPMDRFVCGPRPRKAVDQWPIFNIGIDIDDIVTADAVLDDQQNRMTRIRHLVRTMVVELLKTHGLYYAPTTWDGRVDPGRDALPTAVTATTAPAVRDIVGTGARGFASWPKTKYAQSAQRGPKAVVPRPDETRPETTSKFFDGALCLDDADKDDKDDNEYEDDDGGDGDNLDEACRSDGIGAWHRHALASGDARLTRVGLDAAIVVGQVDHKFVLARAPARVESSGGNGGAAAHDTTLILIDQHAADERCRIEALLRGYFAAPAPGACASRAVTAALVPPLQFELAAHEVPRLVQAQAYFGYWGVVYDVLPARPPGDRRRAGARASTDIDIDTALLRVRALPACIEDRCRHASTRVVDLIRREIWAHGERVAHGATDVAVPSPAVDTGRDTSWTARLRGCPRGILALANAKACRAAIKFNDPLTHEQCVDLLNRLRQCEFPFQCAHGRPSMVPVLNLSRGDDDDDDDVWPRARPGTP